MNLKEIKEILTLMNDNNLNEIEIERDGLKLKLKKSVEGMVMAPTHYAVESLPAPKAAPVAIPAGGGTGDTSKNTKDIKSPMVGTFYRSPSSLPLSNLTNLTL